MPSEENEPGNHENSAATETAQTTQEGNGAPEPERIYSPTEQAEINDLLRILSRRLIAGLSILIILMITALYWLKAEIDGGVPFIVLLCGVGGGVISIQRRLKSFTKGDLELMVSSWFYTYLAPVVGGLLALVLYLIFVSGFLSGQFFPEFEAGKDPDGNPLKGFQSLFEQRGKSYEDYAKLLVWSFIAGYSEKFVTDVVGRFEGAAVSSVPKVNS